MILLAERVFRLGQDADEIVLAQSLQRGDDRQTADQLGDDSEFQKIVRLDQLEELADVVVALALDRGVEADGGGIGALLDDLVEPVERAAADEEDVGRIDLDELLLRVLASALRRDVGDRTLDDLQKRLLHALAGYVAGDGRVFGLAGDLVDLVDVDDAALGQLDVKIRRLQQAEQDVLDVLADVAGLGQRRGVGDGERHVQDLGQRLGEEGLAGAGGADEQDVALLQLHIGVVLEVDALIVVVDRDG